MDDSIKGRDWWQGRKTCDRLYKSRTVLHGAKERYVPNKTAQSVKLMRHQVERAFNYFCGIQKYTIKLARLGPRKIL